MWSGDEKVGHLKNSGGKERMSIMLPDLYFLLSSCPQGHWQLGPLAEPWDESFPPRLCPVLAYLRGGTRVKAEPFNSDRSKDWWGRKTQKLPLNVLVLGSSLNTAFPFC